MLLNADAYPELLIEFVNFGDGFTLIVFEIFYSQLADSLLRIDVAGFRQSLKLVEDLFFRFGVKASENHVLVYLPSNSIFNDTVDDFFHALMFVADELESETFKVQLEQICRKIFV